MRPTDSTTTAAPKRCYSREGHGHHVWNDKGEPKKCPGNPPTGINSHLPPPSNVAPWPPDEADEAMRASVTRQWAEDWNSPEDAVYDEPFPFADEAYRRRFIQRVRRIPEVRKAYRQIKNGHRGGPVAVKPALRGRRHGW